MSDSLKVFISSIAVARLSGLHLGPLSHPPEGSLPTSAEQLLQLSKQVVFSASKCVLAYKDTNQPINQDCDPLLQLFQKEVFQWLSIFQMFTTQSEKIDLFKAIWKQKIDLLLRRSSELAESLLQPANQHDHTVPPCFGRVEEVAEMLAILPLSNFQVVSLRFQQLSRQMKDILSELEDYDPEELENNDDKVDQEIAVSAASSCRSLINIVGGLSSKIAHALHHLTPSVDADNGDLTPANDGMWLSEICPDIGTLEETADDLIVGLYNPFSPTEVAERGERICNTCRRIVVIFDENWPKFGWEPQISQLLSLAPKLLSSSESSFRRFSSPT